MRNLFLALLSLCFALPVAAQNAFDIPPSPIAQTQLLLHAPEIRANEPIRAGVLFTLPEGWHIYWRNPGDSGIPTSIAWNLPEGISAGEMLWPAPERFEMAGLVNYGYGERVILPSLLTPSRDGISGTVEAKVDYLVCKETCIPESAMLKAELPRSKPQAEALLNETMQQLPAMLKEEARYVTDDASVTLQLPAAALPNAAGMLSDASFLPEEDGIISNSAEQSFTLATLDGAETLTLRMKRGSMEPVAAWHGVLRLQHGPQEQPTFVRLQATHDVAASTTADSAGTPDTANGDANTAPTLSLAVAVLFAFLGGIVLNAMPCVLPILSLKALALAKKSGAEQRVARAQGLAYTAGVIASFLLIAAIMLALKAGGAAIGWGFQLQEPGFVAALYFLMLLVALNLLGLFELPVLLGNAQTHDHSLRGAFFTGALAVALATPCTAPFMAPALGATLALSTPATLLVFTALGLGLAAPFLLISLWPAARRALPKPGVWMLRFKQFLAFPMFATAAWLLWVLTNAQGSMALLQGLGLSVLLAWLLWWAHVTPSATRRRMTRFAAFLIVAGGIYLLAAPAARMEASGIPTVAYDAQTLAALRKEGTPVLVDATADWCITCKINERIALRDSSVQQLMAERGVTLMVADWTARDASITEYLASFGRNGVPLYVYYAPGAEPVVLPQLLTPALVREALLSTQP